MKYLFYAALLFCACSPQDQELTPQSIIDRAIEAHGLDNVFDKKIEFDFRERHYTLEREQGKYAYTRSFEDSLGSVRDVLVNSSQFTRFVNGQELELDDEWTGKYLNSVNSVLYFIQLPLTLNDPAAIKKYLGVQNLKGKSYHLLEIRFEEEGGGKDFEDVFLYWFDVESFQMDYLAYSYITDGGGVRFREAINRRNIKGLVFQDYINYKPGDKLTPLDQLAGLYEKGELLELSRIENVNVVVN